MGIRYVGLAVGAAGSLFFAASQLDAADTGGLRADQGDGRDQRPTQVTETQQDGQLSPQAVSADRAGTDNTPDPAGSDVENQVFQPSFFDKFRPQTALDMVNRLPGFVFDAGSSARGFGGTAGNVLIDGARPTSKSGGLDEALSRIPATQVARIEVQRGAIGAGEAAGQNIVANVVRLKNVSSGTWSVEIRQFGDNAVLPSLNGSFSTRLLGWDASFQLDSFIKDEDRTAVITNTNAAGEVLRIRTEKRLEDNRDASLSFDAGRNLFGGRLQMNGRIGFDSWYGDTEWLGRGLGPVDADPIDRFFNDDDFENWEAELGLDWSRTFESGWRLRLIGLRTLDDWTSVNAVQNDAPVGTPVGFITFNATEKSTETIFRTTLGKSAGAFSPEFGIEGAINTLDGTLEIIEEDGDRNEISYRPPSPVSVKEERAEAFTNIIWRATETIAVNGGLNYEISRISTEGAEDNSQTFKFLKPTIGITYTASAKLQLGMTAERVIGQLDFGDFAASANAADDRVIAGNPNLRPDRLDRLQGTLDYQFGTRGAVSLRVYHEWQTDVLEQTILPSGGQGIGNAGDAVQYGIEANFSLPTDQILKGGLFEVELTAQESSFEDPLTGESRRRNDFRPLNYAVDFRHDVQGTQWSWGVEYDSAFNDHFYFINEFEDFEGSDRWDAYVETTQFFGTRIRLSSFFLGGVDRDRIRNFYSPTRGGAFIGQEIHARERDMGFRFEVAGQF